MLIWQENDTSREPTNIHTCTDRHGLRTDEYLPSERPPDIPTGDVQAFTFAALPSHLLTKLLPR